MTKKFLVPLSVPDDPYAAGWDGSVEVPTKNAVYDKIQTLSGGGVTDVMWVGPSAPSDSTVEIWYDTDETAAATMEQVLRGYTNINTQSGTTYTLVLTDAGALLIFTSATAVTLTVPPFSSVAFGVGNRIDIIQTGAGKVTAAPGAGVTLNGTPSLGLRAQYSGASLVNLATNSWVIMGDLT